MPDRPTCKDCRFWDGGHDMCRRRAPVESFAWPGSLADDWCGEHEPHGSDAKAPKLKTEYIEGAGWVTNHA